MVPQSPTCNRSPVAGRRFERCFIGSIAAVYAQAPFRFTHGASNLAISNFQTRLSAPCLSDVVCCSRRIFRICYPDKDFSFSFVDFNELVCPIDRVVEVTLVPVIVKSIFDNGFASLLFD